MIYLVSPSGQAQKDGTLWVLTDEWRSAMTARLSELGKTHSWLEAQIGAPNGTVNALLRRVVTSRLVDDICRVLAIDPPIQAPDDARRIIEIYRSKGPKARATMLRVLEAITEHEKEED